MADLIDNTACLASIFCDHLLQSLTLLVWLRKTLQRLRHFTGAVFIMRMCEYRVTWMETGARHPVHMADIEPLVDGIKGEWGPEANGASVFISGSETDWPIEGDTRARRMAHSNSPNDHLCIATSQVGMYESYTSRFTEKRDTPFSSWRNGGRFPQHTQPP